MKVNSEINTKISVPIEKYKTKNIERSAIITFISIAFGHFNCHFCVRLYRLEWICILK